MARGEGWDTSVLERVDSPDDLRGLDRSELETLAQEIRDRIISVVSRTGGHLAPSLGVVELTIALHYCLDSPGDRIIWDVGHQAYAHKLLTGRRDRFDTIRTRGGLSGFPRITESEHDAFGTGHASTSISAALGIACARDHRGEDYRVVAVIGDGALTGGMAFEGLNQAGHLKKDLIVVLNDNRMSISKNVGALSTYLTRLISAPVYRRFEADVWELMGKFPTVGGRARGVARRIKESLKNLVVPGVLFEELGFRYYGPVDGHNLGELIDLLEDIKDFHGPQLVHVVTTKGKGYSHAEADACRFHGIGSFDKKTGLLEKKSGAPPFTQVFGDTLVEIAVRRDDVVAVTAAMPDGTGLTCFKEAYPDRFYDVGIAEQHAVTFAAGLARAGMKPVVAIYSTFLQRAIDQIVHDVALQNLGVVFAVDRSGVVGEDGPTHHGTLDLTYLQMIPGLVVMAPRDENQLRHMLYTAVEYGGGPAALRYPRDYGYGVPENGALRALEIGKGEMLAEGTDAAIIALGSMVLPSLEGARLLAERGISAAVVDARFLKPLDADLIVKVAKSVDLVVTVEENTLRGGFGSAVAGCLEEAGVRKPLHMLGIPDRFVEHAARSELLADLGLTARGIADGVVEALGRRARGSGDAGARTGREA
jgi:1-deoxy-D-xylulose-5-phosphate synthase